MDATIEVLKINVGKSDDGFTSARKQVVKFLKKCKESGSGGVELRRRNIIHENDNEEEEEETTSSTLQRFNDKLRKKEEERLKRMNKSFCDEDSPEDVEICPPKKVIQHGVFISEDDEGSQSEVILSYPSTSSSEVKSTCNSHVLDNQRNKSQSSGIPYEGIQTFSDASDYDENGFGKEDYTSVCMDSDNVAEMVDLASENNFNASNSSYVDPVTGVRTSSYSGGQLPSLVSEKTAEWLIDDVGPRTAKRKRPVKQTKLTGSIQQRKRTSTAAQPSPRLNLSKSKPSHPKQAKLVVSKESRTHPNAISAPGLSVRPLSTPLTVRPDVSPTVAAGNARINTPETNTRHNVAQGGTPPMRLRVRVQDKVFLIPCPRSNAQESKNIGWLAEQVNESQELFFFFLSITTNRLIISLCVFGVTSRQILSA